MDCRESFEEAIRLREAILETKVSATQSATKSRRSHYSLKVPMVIVGNKCDKDVKYVQITEIISRRSFSLSLSLSIYLFFFVCNVIAARFFLLQNGHGRGGRAILREPGRVLHLRRGVSEAELPRGRAFLSVIRSGRSTVGDGTESSQEGTADFRLADHVAAVAGT